MPSPLAQRLAQLWQVPLLLLSVVLFGYAAYLLVGPRASLSIDQRIEVARELLAAERPDAANRQLIDILASEKMENDQRARIYDLIAQTIESYENRTRADLPVNHTRIVNNTQQAINLGLKPTAEMHRRMAASHEKLGQPAQALVNYRQAIHMDPRLATSIHRRVIELQLDTRQFVAASTSLDEYLKRPEIQPPERAWALGQRSQILIETERYDEARVLLDESVRIDSDPVALGVAYYRLGLIEYRRRNEADAERQLRMARELLKTGHPLDGEAAYLLGRIFEERRQPEQAMSFYRDVIRGHPGTRASLLSRLGQGVSRAMLGKELDDMAALEDFKAVLATMSTKPGFASVTAEVLAGLQKSGGLMVARNNLRGALETLAYENELTPEPTSEFFGRLARVYELRADQEAKLAETARTPEARASALGECKEYRVKAGDALLALAKAMTVQDDRGRANAMWRAIDLYNRAGDSPRLIETLRTFAQDRPEDPLAPEALLRLGQALYGAGQFDAAIETFERNIVRYPNSIMAVRSAVPLAQVHLARGNEGGPAAERVLLGVLDNNPLVTPEAEEFRSALLELANVYYRQGRYEQAIVRLEEWTRRYASDARVPRALFLMADSYRKSAGELGGRIRQLQTGGGASAAEQVALQMNVAESEAARRDRLGRARNFYERLIERFRSTAPATETDRLYEKLAHFYRADAAFDLGEFESAVKLYDAAAFKYQDDPMALGAYIQIVNAYASLGRNADARTANERAREMLRRMPPSAFAEGTFPMSKTYWEQWLKWSTTSGIW